VPARYARVELQSERACQFAALHVVVRGVVVHDLLLRTDAAIRSRRPSRSAIAGHGSTLGYEVLDSPTTTRVNCEIVTNPFKVLMYTSVAKQDNRRHQISTSVHTHYKYLVVFVVEQNLVENSAVVL